MHVWNVFKLRYKTEVYNQIGLFYVADKVKERLSEAIVLLASCDLYSKMHTLL